MGETGPDGPGQLFKGSGVLIRVLRRFLGTRIRVHGLENIPKGPTLFVVNHFTRFETFILPWVLWQHGNKAVRTLAFKDLFAGPLGKFITQLGAVSTSSPLRNKAIVSDLMKGTWSWVIYPEGVMLKNKDIMHRGRIALSVDDRNRRIPPHTGAAVLALRALFIRDDFKEKARKADGPGLTIHQTLYDVKTALDLAPEDPVMVPVNLTYYPIRPRENALLHLAQRLNRDLPARLTEELTIEGNLLLGGDIDVSIGPPTPVRKFVDTRLPGLPRFAMVPAETRMDIATRILARPLTDTLMSWIYQSVTVNIDHLFALALFRLRRGRFSLNHMKAVIWESARAARSLGLRLHPTLEVRELDRLVALEETPAFMDIFLLAAAEGVIVMDGNRWRLKPGALHKSAPFHRERLVGTLRVIAHEAEPLAPLVRAVDKAVNRGSAMRRRKLLSTMWEAEKTSFENRWGLTFRVGESKLKEIGAPFFLPARGRTGIVLVHGYKASPGEVRELAEALQRHGYPVVAVRLDGHGTTPEDLATATMEQWTHAVDRGIALMAQQTPRVILGGFSMGGLLALMAASRKRGRLAGVFTVNAALRLQDFKARLVPALVWWNRLLKRSHLGQAASEYVVSPADHPDTNYDRHPLSAVVELRRTMEAAEKALPMVHVPALVIQATGDPVVKPEGATRIHRRIPAARKELFTVDLDHHVIIRGPGLARILPKVLEFLEDCQSRQHGGFSDT